MKRLDLSGQRFDRLVALRLDGHNKSGKVVWLCRCDCGKETRVTSGCLRSGNTKSCGCRKRDATAARNRSHGMSSTNTYYIWRGMLDRCQNPKNKCYDLYGGRGIRICERWEIFENFFADMGERPDGLSIDRIDSDGMYEPSNCRWADIETQVFNKRNTVRVEVEGRMLTLLEVSREYGVPFKRVRSRYQDGFRGKDLTYPGNRSVLVRGSKKPASKLSEEDVAQIKRALASGGRVTDLAKQYGVSSPVISHIKSGKVWRHVEI